MKIFCHIVDFSCGPTVYRSCLLRKKSKIELHLGLWKISASFNTLSSTPSTTNCFNLHSHNKIFQTHHTVSFSSGDVYRLIFFRTGHDDPASFNIFRKILVPCAGSKLGKSTWVSLIWEKITKFFPQNFVCDEFFFVGISCWRVLQFEPILAFRNIAPDRLQFTW